MSPTLASAAMAAVPPERSGMAAGAVNTARQLGFALGIAICGSVFNARIADQLTGDATAVARGGAQVVVARAPAGARADLEAAIHAAVGSALGTTLLTAGLVGALGAGVVLVLMRERRSDPAREAVPGHA